MLYEVPLHSSGGERFTIEREAPLADGDTFEEDSESYRVLTIPPGYGPFAGVIEVVHQLSGGFEGQASDIEIQAHETIALKRRMEEIVAQHTRQPLSKVAKDMERDYFMTAAEAQE